MFANSQKLQRIPFYHQNCNREHLNNYYLTSNSSHYSWPCLMLLPVVYSIKYLKATYFYKIN
jgi:hypothetical protein